MNQNLLEELQKITGEEQAILDRRGGVDQSLYADGGQASPRRFVVDSKKMLEQGRLIAVRPHTRFVDFPAHKHNYVEVMYVCRGQITHQIEDRIVRMEQGDLLFLNQHVSHGIRAAAEQDVAINLIIQPAFFETPSLLAGGDRSLTGFLAELLRKDSEKGQYLLFKTNGILQIENLMENLIYSLVHDPGTEDEINRSLMELLFLYLAKYAKTLGEDSSSRFEDVLVMAARRYIDRTYQTATLGELAATLHETDSFVSRLIKAKTGKTFKELLQEKRLKAACALLRQTDLPVSDIAAAVGYENSSFFHRLFRERVGYSPADYRRRQKSAQESV